MCKVTYSHTHTNYRPTLPHTYKCGNVITIICTDSPYHIAHIILTVSMCKVTYSHIYTNPRLTLPHTYKCGNAITIIYTYSHYHIDYILLIVTVCKITYSHYHTVYNVYYLGFTLPHM